MASRIREFVQALGLVFKAQNDKINDLEERLSQMGEPVVNVAPAEISVSAPEVNVAAPEVTVDLEAITDALNGMADPTEALAAIAAAVSGVTIPEADFSGLEAAIREDGTAEAVGQVSDAIDEIKVGQDTLSRAVSDLTQAVLASVQSAEKSSGATQIMFNETLSAVNGQGEKLERAISAPKRIIEKNGKPVGVESILN